MKPIRRLPGYIGFGICLCICAIVISSMSPPPVLALLFDQDIDQFLGDFEPGTLSRTALYKRGPDEPVAPWAPSGSVGEYEEDAYAKLIRIGVVDPLVDPPDLVLPQALAQHGAVALNDRIYVIGGTDGSGFVSTAQNCEKHPDSPTGTVTCPNVWSGEISRERDSANRISGESLTADGWRSELPLPEAIGETGNFSEWTRGLQNMAVVAYDTGGATDYIYVLGGLYRQSSGGNAYTSRAVWVGEVDASTKEITNWTSSHDAAVTRSGDAIKYPLTIPGRAWDGSRNPSGFQAYTLDQDGLQGPGAAVMTVEGTPYLYLMGGEYTTGNNFAVHDHVYYARIGSDGLLYRPDTTNDTPANLGWMLEDDGVPTVTGGTGRADFGVITPNYVNGRLLPNSQTDDPIMHIIGGTVVRDTSNNRTVTSDVRRAQFATDGTGTISWVNDGVTMEANLYGHTVAEINNAVYVLGGFPNADTTPTGRAWSGMIEDNGLLYDFIDGPDSQYFFGPEEGTLNLPLRVPVGDHTTVTLNYDGVALVYVMGGLIDNENPYSDQIYLLRVFDSTSDETPYAPSGWFTSRIYDIFLEQDLIPEDQISTVEIEQVSWDVNFGQNNNAENDYGGMDLTFEYRVSNPSGSCEVDPEWPTDGGWKPITSSATTPAEADYDDDVDENGEWSFAEQTTNSLTQPSLSNTWQLNTFAIPGVQGERDTVRCFQYRVRMESNGAAGADSESPRLDRVGLVIWTPNSPDLHVYDELNTPDVVEGLRPVWFENSQGEEVEGYLTDLYIMFENLYLDESVDPTVERPADTLALDVDKPAGWTANTRNDFGDEWKDFFYIDMFVFGEDHNTPEFEAAEDQANEIVANLPITDNKGYVMGDRDVEISYTYLREQNQYGHMKYYIDPNTGAYLDPIDVEEPIRLESSKWCAVPYGSEVPNLPNDCPYQPLGDPTGQEVSDVFQKSGDYTVCVALDSSIAPTDASANNYWPQHGYIEEVMAGDYEAEDNNVTCINLSVLVPPDITITPGDETLEINEGNTDSFTISFDPPPGTDLTIPFEWSGNLGYGSDLWFSLDEAGTQRITTNSLNVPAETPELTIYVQALADTTPQPELKYEIGTFTLLSDEIRWNLISSDPGRTPPDYEVDTLEQSIEIFDPNGIDALYEVNISEWSGTQIGPGASDTFTITRAPGQGAALVQFSLSGDAVRGTDYEIYRSDDTIVGSNTLPMNDGQTSATFRVESLFKEGDTGDNKSVTITLDENPGRYILKEPGSVQFTLTREEEEEEEEEDPPTTPTIYLPLVAR